MVPLSVTQAEQIAAIRSWAATRAIAATAIEDRPGYEATAERPDHLTRPPRIPEQHTDGRPRWARTRRKIGRLLMSVEIILIPLAIAAFSAWKAKTPLTKPDGKSLPSAPGCETNASSNSALVDTGAQVERQGDVITARWADNQGRFTKDPTGIWSVHFVGDTTLDEASDVVAHVDAAYGRQVSKKPHPPTRTGTHGRHGSESETVEDDHSVTLVLNVNTGT